MDLYEAMGHTLALQYGELTRERRGALLPVCLIDSVALADRHSTALSRAEPCLVAPCWTAPAGGSEAHSSFFQRQRGDWEAATQSRCVICACVACLACLLPLTSLPPTMFHAQYPSPPTLALPFLCSDLLTTLRRFYSNASGADGEKQGALNLFLGAFRPPGLPGQPHLWELVSDAYLHMQQQQQQEPEGWWDGGRREG